jgi:hypothetical protein
LTLCNTLCNTPVLPSGIIFIDETVSRNIVRFRAVPVVVSFPWNHRLLLPWNSAKRIVKETLECSVWSVTIMLVDRIALMDWSRLKHLRNSDLPLRNGMESKSARHISCPNCLKTFSVRGKVIFNARYTYKRSS